MPDNSPERKVVSDAHRVMRDISASTVCTACGKHFTENLIWFEKHHFTCPACGASLDDKPIRKLLKESLQRLHSALSKPHQT